MSKYPVFACIALAILMSCSKEQLNAEKDPLISETNNLSGQNGGFYAKAPATVTPIVFYSNSREDGNYINNCMSTGRKVQKYGSFNGNLKGFGKINSSLSTYEILPCEALPIDPPNAGEETMYSMVMVGKVALNATDYCKITIRGNIYPAYLESYGFYGGNFIGTAITESGAGKLKGLNNKTFNVYNGNAYGPGINLETGLIILVMREAL
jgi:hypothetical protein